MAVTVPAPCSKTRGPMYSSPIYGFWIRLRLLPSQRRPENTQNGTSDIPFEGNHTSAIWDNPKSHWTKRRQILVESAKNCRISGELQQMWDVFKVVQTGCQYGHKRILKYSEMVPISSQHDPGIISARSQNNPAIFPIVHLASHSGLWPSGFYPGLGGARESLYFKPCQCRYTAI